MIIIIKASLFLIFLFAVAYFAGIETALTSLSTLSLKKLKSEHPRRNKYLSFWERKPNEILASILVGTNLAIIGAGVLATSIALDLSMQFSAYKHAIFAGVPVIAMLLILACGEIVPKIFSRYKAEIVASYGVYFVVVFNKMFAPISHFLLKVSERVINVFSKQATYETPFLKPEELKIVLMSDNTSPLSTQARRMVNNILDFGKTRISHVMIPRDQIQAVELKGDIKDIINRLVEKGYSRIPVYKDDIDNIVGIIYSKDINLSLRRGSLFIIEDLIRPAYFVPESARVDRVLREFKTGHQHMAIVVDEFGSTVGIATIEDLVEEIVGEIWDEYDLKEKTIFPLPDGFHLIRASESLEKVNAELNLNLPENEFTTISGWVLDMFGRIPKVGESVRWGNVEVVVLDASRKRVLRVKLRIAHQ